MTTQRPRDVSRGGSGLGPIAVGAGPPAVPVGALLASGAADAPSVPIGNWDLVQVLGSGARADVFLARHRHNGRRVAVKLVRHDATSTYDRRRHLEEIRAIGAIDHRNVARLYEAGELDDRRIYLVMEHLEGETLRAVLDERGPLGSSVLLQIGILVARGLDAAHARGIVHRDLKPSNVMITPTGNGRFTVKLIDFAKLIDGTPPIVGTLAYMSPEAVRGDALDHRTDIYSFGVLLHHASTGGYPDRERPGAFGAQGSRNPIPNPSACTLETIIERCVRRAPADRFPTTGHLIAELEIARGRLGRSPARRPRSSPVDDATTAWWSRDDTVFATDHTATEVRPAPAPSVRSGVVPPAVFVAPSVDSVVMAPAVFAASSAAFETSGLLVVPAAERARQAPPIGVPRVVGRWRAVARRAIEGRARRVVGATLVAGLVLGTVTAIANRGRARPAARADVASASLPPNRDGPPPPPEPAPRPPPAGARASCTPAAPERLGLPSRAAFAWYGSGPDAPRGARATPQRRGPRRDPRDRRSGTRRGDDEVEVEDRGGDR